MGLGMRIWNGIRIGKRRKMGRKDIFQGRNIRFSSPSLLGFLFLIDQLKSRTCINDATFTYADPAYSCIFVNHVNSIESLKSWQQGKQIRYCKLTSAKNPSGRPNATKQSHNALLRSAFGSSPAPNININLTDHVSAIGPRSSPPET